MQRIEQTANIPEEDIYLNQSLAPALFMIQGGWSVKKNVPIPTSLCNARLYYKRVALSITHSIILELPLKGTHLNFSIPYGIDSSAAWCASVC